MARTLPPRVPSGAALSETHLLLLPPDATVADVRSLVLTRLPDAVDGTPGLRLGRHSRLHGPLVVDASAAGHVPGGWPLVYALAAPRERDEPPWPGLTDSGGLYRAFPDGFPVRAERRGVDLMLAVARRLGGAVRVAGSGVVLRPDPASVVDVVVHAQGWLGPEATLAVVRGVEPTARLATDPGPRSAAPAGPGDEVSDAVTGLRPGLRLALHRAADRFDAAAKRAQAPLDRYAIVVEVGPEARDGVVEVRVHPAESAPPALTGRRWLDEAISYEVRWGAPDPAQAEHDAPGAEHRASRTAAHRVVDRVAGALLEVTDGVALDGDGFIIDRYDLAAP